jgi:hypothetical protein
MAEGSGTKDDPWRLTTAPGTAPYTMHRDDDAELTRDPRNNRMRTI